MNHEMYSSQVGNRPITTNLPKNHAELQYLSSVYKFRDIEEVIQLAHRVKQPFFNTKLLRYGSYYYLVVLLPEQRVIRNQAGMDNLILEYGERAQVSIHRLQEYGRMIVANNALAAMVEHFKL